MRFTAFIFSLYIFALALLPCGDGEGHSHSDENQVAFTQTHGDSSDHHADMCSPFCLCQCCHTSVVEHFAPFVPNSISSNPSLKSGYIRNFQNGFPTGILQPPRA